MRIYSFTLASIFVLILGCQKADQVRNSVELRIGNWTAALDLQLSLGPDIQESRCPLTADCFWEGEATGILLTEKNGVVHEIPYVIKGACLASDGICGNTLDTLGYLFVFKNLFPIPGDTLFSNPMDYKLLVEVSQ